MILIHPLLHADVDSRGMGYMIGGIETGKARAGYLHVSGSRYQTHDSHMTIHQHTRRRVQRYDL